MILRQFDDKFSKNWFKSQGYEQIVKQFDKQSKLLNVFEFIFTDSRIYKTFSALFWYLKELQLQHTDSLTMSHEVERISKSLKDFKGVGYVLHGLYDSETILEGLLKDFKRICLHSPRIYKDFSDSQTQKDILTMILKRRPKDFQGWYT